MYTICKQDIIKVKIETDNLHVSIKIVIIKKMVSQHTVFILRLFHAEKIS